MQARMTNPAMLLPDALPAIQTLIKATHKAGVPQPTMELVHLRASQINGCSACVAGGALSAKKAGETDERLFAVAAWREAPWFTDADRPDAVSDTVWAEAARHYDEQQLAALILWIATTNLFNRLNATIREPAGATWG